MENGFDPSLFLNYLSGADRRKGGRRDADAQDGRGGLSRGWGRHGGGGTPPSLRRHDEKYHGGHYDGKGSCRYREALAKGDGADLLPGFGGAKGRPSFGGAAARPHGEPGARMPLSKVGDVAPGKAVALSSADFGRVLRRTKPENRILALADLHDAGLGALDTGDDVGTVILAGDVSQGGATSESRKIGMEEAVEGGMRWLREEFFPLCERHQDRRMVLIAGNHDHFLGTEEAEGIEWPGNVDYLFDSEAVVNGMRIYGTPWCAQRKGVAKTRTENPSFSRTPFEIPDGELAERYAKIPEGLDVLVVHQTPKADGYDGDLSGFGHDGSEELAVAIRRAKPKLVVCGHLHAGDHRPFRIGDSVVVNAAQVLGRSDVAYTPHRIAMVPAGRKDGGAGFVLDGEDDHVKPPPKVDVDPKSLSMGYSRAPKFDVSSFLDWLSGKK